jgi:hypothetical protein
MECPKCKRQQRCGCRSCKNRVKQPMLRAEKLFGDSVKCAYCRTIFHVDYVADYEWRKYDEYKKNKPNKADKLINKTL